MENPENRGKILIIDNYTDLHSKIKDPLSERGHSVHAVQDGDKAIELIKNNEIDLIVANIFDGVDKGKDFIERVNQHSPETEVIIITENECYKTAVEAIKMGVYDYVKAPVKHQKLIKKIEDGLRKRFYKSELKDLKEAYSRGEYIYFGLVSRNSYMQKVFDLISKVTRTDTTVLIQGETGTGKELVARAIHENSMRKNNSFIVVNCAALTETLLESELFGHEKGAFTGAFKQKLGRFELANKGTIFLDEVGDLPLSTQVKLLRVLQTREFERVGGTEIIKCNTRVIGATNRDLKKHLSEGKFREDLFYRLNVFPITLPSLKERLDDIPLLVIHFVEKSCKNLNKNIKDISQDAVDILMKYDWPGNVREFENVIERSVLMEWRDVLTDVLIKPKINSYRSHDAGIVNTDLSFRKYMKNVTDDVERKYIVSMLMKYKGNIRLVSNKTGLDRKTMYRKIKEYGIEIKEYRMGS